MSLKLLPGLETHRMPRPTPTPALHHEQGLRRSFLVTYVYVVLHRLGVLILGKGGWGHLFSGCMNPL